MGKIDTILLALAQTYTDESIEGYGVQKGKNCQIEKTEDIEGGKKITFGWYDENQVKKEATLNVMNGEQGEDGRGIKSSYVDENDHFIIVYDDDTEEDCGTITVIGIDTLSELKDVELEDVADGDVLKYDATKKKFINGEGGGGGSAVLTDDLTSAITVGGISAGTQYEKDTPLEDVLRDMLEPTLYPTLTNPSASLSYNSSSYYAVGSSVSATTANVTLNRGSINPAYGTSGYRSGVATGYTVSTSGADTEFSQSNTTGSFSVPALTRSTKGSIVISGQASYAQGEQPKDSKGNNYQSPLSAGSVSSSKTLNFILPYYYGASDTSSISDFEGLSQSVTAKGQKTFNYTTNNQYMVFAYDSSYGNLKTILDGNGFDVTGGWTKTTKTIGGFSYNVYVADSPTTDTNAPFTFKY